MATTQLTRPLTYDDLLAMPDDLKRYEIINGVLFVSPAPNVAHQIVAVNLSDMVSAYVRHHRLGRCLFAPVDVRLSPHDVVEPDLLFLSQDQFDRYKGGGMIDEPPALVVEIISPSSRRTDTVDKAALYARADVPEYWLVDSETRTFRMLVLREGIYHDAGPVEGAFHSTVIDGLVIDPRTLFAGLA